MALVELTSELAIGAGTSVGSPEGRHTAGSDLGVVDVITDIDATGFTLDVSSFPTQFTFANLPQIGLMEAFSAKEPVNMVIPQEFTVRGYTVTGDRADRNIGGIDIDEFSTKRLSNFDIEKRYNIKSCWNILSNKYKIDKSMLKGLRIIHIIFDR